MLILELPLKIESYHSFMINGESLKKELKVNLFYDSFGRKEFSIINAVTTSIEYS